MSKDPNFPLYTQDFLVGTMFMTDEEVGIYVRLLCVQHQHGGIIDKDIFKEKTKDFPKVFSKFKKTPEGYYNQRLMDEMAKRQKKSRNLSANALKRWKREKEKQCKSNAIASRRHMPSENENENENESDNGSENIVENIKEIVEYLNKKIGSNYKQSSRKTKELIRARFNEGFTVDDFKAVIDKMYLDWGEDEKMSAYLRPETLFSNKFEGYLNRIQVKHKSEMQKTFEKTMEKYGDVQ